MIEGVALRLAGILAGILSPKNMISLAKYMYIKSLLDHYDINLIMDVGANVGQFARSMRKIGYRGRIISFEPASAQFDRLDQAARGDVDWQACNYALSDTRGKQAMNVMADSVFSSFNQPSASRTTMFTEGNSIRDIEVVELRTLSDVVKEFGLTESLKTTFLKCDTQGHDMRVLKGAHDFLRSFRVLQVELSVTPIYENSPGMTEMLAFIEGHGFAPVATFPINRLPDWSAAELDYLGVNRMIEK